MKWLCLLCGAEVNKEVNEIRQYYEYRKEKIRRWKNKLWYHTKREQEDEEMYGYCLEDLMLGEHW